MYSDFTSTPIFNKPAIRYPAFGPYAPIHVPMHITAYKTPTRNAKVTTITGMPLVDIPTNTAFTGTNIGMQGIELPKLHVEGFMQTPMAVITTVSPPEEQPLLSLFDYSGNSYFATYADIIATFAEGRANGNIFGEWQTQDPSWFRDPYGRVFTNPRIIDFTANYVEGVPGRTSFTMTMQI